MGNSEIMSGWLTHVPQDIALKLLKVARKRTYEADEVIYAVGQEQRSLFGIRTGRVRMFISVNDHPLRLAHVAGPGFWFGEFEFIMPQPRMMEMIALERVEAIEISWGAFEPIALEDPAAWHSVAILTGLNLATVLGAADDLLIGEALPRLVAVLLRLSGYRNAYQGTPPVSQIPVTQRELADASCLSRSRTASLLSDLVNKGAIATDYRAIRILKVEELKKMLL